MNREQLLNFGRALRDIGAIDEAILRFREALAEDPTQIEAYVELAATCIGASQPEQAELAIREGLAIAPQQAELLSLRADILMENGAYEDAEHVYRKALGSKPRQPEIIANLALSLKEQARFALAMSEYEKALRLDPKGAHTRFNRSLLLLLLGRYAEGFREYEWRKLKRQPLGHRPFPQPLWRGEDIAGKTILVHHEQGMGDAIQFSRYVPLLRQQKGARALYAAHPPLRRLLQTMGDVDFVDVNDPALRFDMHCPLLSLPLGFGTRVETIPGKTPYLAAEPNRIAHWRARIGEHGFKVGVAWLGSGGRFAANRLFPPAMLARLADVPDVRLISLHRVAEAPRGPADAVEWLGEDFDNGPDAFLDAAAAIACCDLVISCDTALAHLAGALARPTWLVLRSVPHWVWMMDRANSPWYPSVRLFRQPAPGAWGGVFGPLEEALRDAVAQGGESR